MSRLNYKNNGGSPGLTWLRRGHRWVGLGTALFLLMFAVTGIGINHSNDWNLDQRFVGSDWLLDAYGIRAPEPTASFADRRHRVTQLGSRLYFDEREIPREIDELTGMTVLDDLAVVTTGDSVLLLTPNGDLVQQIDLTGELPGPVVRIGRADNRPVIQSAGHFFIGDANVTGFADRSASPPAGIAWPAATSPATDLQAELQRQYRGRGLTVERLLLDLHSGRFASTASKALLDIVAVAIMILCVTGLYIWIRRGGRRNGNGASRGQDERNLTGR